MTGHSIVDVRMRGRTFPAWVAACSCGWRSPGEPHRDQSRKVWADHLEREVDRYLDNTDSVG